MSAAAVPTYPVGTIAKLLMMTERRVQQLSKDGVIPRAERGRYELAPAVQGYIRFLQERVSGNPELLTASDEYQAHRTRKIAAEAALAELELIKERGSVVEVDVLRDEVGRSLDALRARLLGIGAALAAIVAMERDVAVCQDIIDRAINEALDEISSASFDWQSGAEVDGEERDEDALRAANEAAADTDTFGVG